MIDDEKTLIARIEELSTSRANLALVLGLTIGTLHNIKHMLQDCIKDDLPISTSSVAKALLKALENREELLDRIVMKEFYPEQIQSASEIISERLNREGA